MTYDTLYCLGCSATTSHLCEPLAGTIRTRLTCRACGRVSHREPRHYLYRFRSTACGLELDGRERTTTQLVPQVECPDCALVMVELLADLAPPDWRPDAPVAEDYYAA